MKKAIFALLFICSIAHSQSLLLVAGGARDVSWFLTDQSTANDTLLVLVGSVGESTDINFGVGGADSTITYTGTPDTIYHHYSGSGVYAIRLQNTLSEISSLTLYKRTYCWTNRISNMTNLTYLKHILQVGQPQIMGNLRDLSNMSLAHLELSPSDSVLGDLSSLSSMALDYLYLSTNVTDYDVTGNISALSNSGFVNGVYLTANDLTYSTFNIPDTWMVMYFGICGLSTSEVDQIIIDVEANGTSGGVLDLDQNENRSATSTTAYNALISRSWTVYVGGP